MCFEFWHVRLGTTSLQRLAIVLLAVLGSGRAEASIDYSNDKPIWEQVDVLICQGNKLRRCSSDRCSTDVSTAVWRVDFQQSKIVYLTYNYTERILEKSFNFYKIGSVNSVFMEERALRFFIVKDDKFPTRRNRIVAAVVSPEYSPKGLSLYAMDFDCFETR